LPETVIGRRPFTEIRVDDARRIFGSRRSRHVAVDGVDLTIGPSTSLGIVGESGSGKSTLSRMLVGLDEPTSGTVHLNDVPVHDWLAQRERELEFRRTVQYVPQDTSSSFDPRRTLRDSVQSPLRTLYGLTGRELDDAFDDVLESLQLDPALADRKPHRVSGGQRQRFAIARALIVRPRVIVCDEVVSALDVSVQGAILNLLKQYIAEHDAAIVFVSHGLPATAFICSRMSVMHHGRVVESGPTEQVVHDPADDYTRSLIDAYRLDDVHAGVPA